MVTFLLVGTILAVIAPFVAFVIAALIHAGPFGDRVFPVELHNDTEQTLIVRLCGNNCTPAYQSVSLAPAASVKVGATIGQMTRFYLHSSAGTLLGCLPLDYRTEINNLTVEASQQEICPGNPLPAPSDSPAP